MGEVILGLLGILLVLGFVGCTIVLPIVAWLRTRAITEIRARLDRLERDFHRSRRADREAAPPAGAVPPSTEQPIPPSAIEVLPTRQPRVSPVAPFPPGVDTATLEAWIGGRGLGWVAVVLLLFAAAFFLKQVFDNRWVGELGRVALGIAAGAALCGAGLRYHQRGGRVFSQMLSAAGVVLLYLATFSAFGYYHLLPQSQAAIFLVALVAETAALAVLYEAPAIALMAVIGGLLTPLLLHSDRDQYRNLFLYLTVLNGGVVALTFFRSWRAIGTTALLGTQLLFWLWYAAHYHPEKLLAASGFQAVLFALHVADSPLAALGYRRMAHTEDLVRQVLNAFLFAGAAYILLDPDYHVWMGTGAIALAIVYTTLAWLLLKSCPDDARPLLVVTATALAFVAFAFPLQAEAAWIPVGWAVQGVALWWFGLRLRTQALQAMGAVLLLLAVGRLVLLDTPYTGRVPFVPLFNRYGLPASVVAACVLGAAAVARRFQTQRGPGQKMAQLGAGLAGVGLVWFLLTIETYTYFMARESVAVESTIDWRRWALTALSVVWAAYAAVVLGVGFRLRSRPLRWAALGLFALTLAKVVLFDLAGLPGFYRVVAFFVLAVMMASAAWAYQKVQLTARAAKREVADVDSV